MCKSDLSPLLSTDHCGQFLITEINSSNKKRKRWSIPNNSPTTKQKQPSIPPLSFLHLFTRGTTSRPLSLHSFNNIFTKIIITKSATNKCIFLFSPSLGSCIWYWMMNTGRPPFVQFSLSLDRGYWFNGTQISFIYHLSLEAELQHFLFLHSLKVNLFTINCKHPHHFQSALLAPTNISFFLNACASFLSPWLIGVDTAFGWPPPDPCIVECITLYRLGRIYGIFN